MKKSQAKLIHEAAVCVGASDQLCLARYDEFRRELLHEAQEHLGAARVLGALSSELANESMRIGSAVQERLRALSPLTLQATGS